MENFDQSQEPKRENANLDALDMIALEASQSENEQAAAHEAILNPVDPNKMPEGQAWAKIPYLLGSLLSKALPELESVYTEKVCLDWGDAMALVSEKYGWEAGETISKYAPEIALAVATFALVQPAYSAIKARKEKKKKEPEKVVLSDDDKRMPDASSKEGLLSESIQ